MEIPDENWIIANVLGILIWMMMFVTYDVVLKLPIHTSWYIAAAVIYFIIAIIDFYAYHSKYEKEEKKPIVSQVRDMMGSIGMGAIILMMFGAYHLYERKKAAQQMKAILSNLKTPIDKSRN